MNRHEIVGYLEAIDKSLQAPATLYVYGSAACILLGEPDRSSLDIDVAGPYSQVEYADLRRAAGLAGIPLDPEQDYRGDHIEWVGALRLCLPEPDPRREIRLWQGAKLAVKTAPVPQLIASKLIRYDEIDQGDIRFLLAQSPIAISEIEAAVKMLPPPFNSDPVVLDNLVNVMSDIDLWRGTKA
jgi:hypothetical protein